MKQGRKEQFPAHCMKTNIILMPKPGKAIIRKKSYKPTAFINIYGKILSNKIQQTTKKIVHHNQMGFISGIQGRTNIQNSINMNG